MFPQVLKTLEPRGPELDPHHSKRRGRAMFEPDDRAAGARRQLREARPAPAGQEPGDVHRGGRQRPHDVPVLPRHQPRRRGNRLVLGSRRRVLVVHGAVRELRRGDGRRSGQGAGRHAAQDPGRDRRVRPSARRQHRPRSPSSKLAGRRSLRGPSRPAHSGRRRRRRGHRVGRRVGDHRRIGARDPRVGW